MLPARHVRSGTLMHALNGQQGWADLFWLTVAWTDGAPIRLKIAVGVTDSGQAIHPDLGAEFLIKHWRIVPRCPAVPPMAQLAKMRDARISNAVERLAQGRCGNTEARYAREWKRIETIAQGRLIELEDALREKECDLTRLSLSRPRTASPDWQTAFSNAKQDRAELRQRITSVNAWLESERENLFAGVQREKRKAYMIEDNILIRWSVGCNLYH